MTDTTTASAPPRINVARLLGIGFAIWFLGTIALRLIGQYLFRPESPIYIAALLLVSFPLMLLLVRRLCTDAGVRNEQLPMAAIVLMMPTFVLDTLSTVFFPIFYPNIDERAAGLYGGWIIWCIGGGLLGVILRRR
ncbi:MAG: DUF5367 family protein [Candidatus Binataceae bacterium]